MKKQNKLLTLALCAALTCSLAACGGNNGGKGSQKPDQTASTSAVSDASTQIANPFVVCKNLDEAAKVAGFSMTVPEAVKGYTLDEISAVQKNMIQVIYQNGDATLSLRKGAGSEDISGDYNQYPEEKTVQVGERSVTMKGKDGKVKVAIWNGDGYAYAVDATGVSEAEMTTLVAGIQ